MPTKTTRGPSRTWLLAGARVRELRNGSGVEAVWRVSTHTCQFVAQKCRLM